MDGRHHATSRRRARRGPDDWRYGREEQVPTHAQTHATDGLARPWRAYPGVCRTPGLNSPVWVPDSGSARSPEPPDANQPPLLVLRPVNRLAHLLVRLRRHGSQRTGDRPHGIREPGDARPAQAINRVSGLWQMTNTSGGRCSEDPTRGCSGIGSAQLFRNLRAPCSTCEHGATLPMETAGHRWTSPTGAGG